MKIVIMDMGYINRRQTENVEVGIGPMIIAGILKSLRCEVEYCNQLIHEFDDVYTIAKSTMVGKADVVMFSTRCDNYILDLYLAKAIKRRNSDIVVIFAGPQATHTSKETLQNFDFIDYVIRNEGEETTKELIIYLRDGGEVSKILGISYRSGGNVYENPDRPMMDKISYLPDYTIIPEDHIKVMRERMSAIRIEAGRGCPYQCIFCSTNHMWKRKYRLKPVEDIYLEMQTVYEKWGIKRFVLEHDSLTADRKKFRSFLTKMKELNTEGFTWKCSSRIDTLAIEDIPLMREAGCTDIYFGIESGSEKMQIIYKKNLQFDRIQRLFSELEKNNIFFIASFICGHPDETIDDIEKTLRLMMLSKVFFNCIDIQLHRLSPENGSELYEEFKTSLVFDQDSVSDQAVGNLTEYECCMIREYPTVFAAFYTPVLSQQMLNVISLALTKGLILIKSYPLTLNIY